MNLFHNKGEILKRRIEGTRKKIITFCHTDNSGQRYYEALYEEFLMRNQTYPNLYHTRIFQ